MMQITGHEAHSYYNNIDAYKDVDDTWSECPCCGLSPKVWEFANGRFTACGCWTDGYRHFSVMAESINSVYSRTKSTEQYDRDGLRKNWNHWCETGELLFSPKKEA